MWDQILDYNVKVRIADLQADMKKSRGTKPGAAR